MYSFLLFVRLLQTKTTVAIYVVTINIIELDGATIYSCSNVYTLSLKNTIFPETKPSRVPPLFTNWGGARKNHG